MSQNERKNFCSFVPQNKSFNISKKTSQGFPSNSKSQQKSSCPVKKNTQKEKSFISYVPQTNKIGYNKKNKTEDNEEEKIDFNQKIDAKEYDIFYIDNIIRKKLSEKITTLDELEKELKKTLYILSLNNGNTIQKLMTEKNIEMLRKRINDIESTFELMFYIYKTESLLEKYKKIMKQNIDKNFVKNKTTKINEELVIIEHNFLLIAKNYIDIKNITMIPKKIECNNCNNEDFFLSDDDDSIFICKKCYFQYEIFDDNPTYRDSDRVNLSNKYTYTRKGHFVEAVKKFQGLQNVDVDKINKVVKIIKDEMLKHNIIPKQGFHNSVTKDNIYDFLSEKNLSSHYDDLNLIFHIITGEKCPDLSPFLNELYKDFDKLETALDSIKDDKRINSLTVNYKLYKLLQHRGYNCRKTDFYILKTKIKEDEHDEKMKQAWEILGWKWIPTF